MTADAPMTDGLTPEVLARWEELAAKATEGPWAVNSMGELRAPSPYNGIMLARAWANGPYGPDAQFIAAARTAVPALLSGVRSRDARIMESECERDHYRLMMAEAKAALAYAAERLDEFSYSELASAIDDEWCDEQTGAPTASRTLARVKAEAWYECRQAVYELNGGDDRIDAELSASNPYRKAAGQ